MVDIPGYEGLYAITSCGKVWSYRKQKFLKYSTNQWGYYIAHLYDEAGNPKSWLIHRLVAIAYLPNPENLPQVNHKDEDKSNNCIGNLEWCTAQYNVDYGSRSKKTRKPVKNLTTGQVYDSVTEAAKALKVGVSAVSCCLSGRNKTIKGVKITYA